MKTVKAILTFPKSHKKYVKGYKKGYSEGQWTGALVVGCPSLLFIITLIIIIAKNS
jgi:hypothetical protein